MRTQSERFQREGLTTITVWVKDELKNRGLYPRPPGSGTPGQSRFVLGITRPLSRPSARPKSSGKTDPEAEYPRLKDVREAIESVVYNQRHPMHEVFRKVLGKHRIERLSLSVYLRFYREVKFGRVKADSFVRAAPEDAPARPDARPPAQFRPWLWR